MAENNSINAPIPVEIANGGTGSSTAVGALTNLVSGTVITTSVVASADKVIIQDSDDADNIKTVTAQSIADLGGGGGLTRAQATAITLIFGR